MPTSSLVSVINAGMDISLFLCADNDTSTLSFLFSSFCPPPPTPPTHINAALKCDLMNSLNHIIVLKEQSDSRNRLVRS